MSPPPLGGYKESLHASILSLSVKHSHLGDIMNHDLKLFFQHPVSSIGLSPSDEV